jgi:hypothetical protein
MKRKGCKPQGIALVERFDSSPQALERARVTLATITGEMTIGQACQRLGLCAARVYRLRADGLQDYVDRCEPRPAGRPRREASPDALRCQELERENAELKTALKIAAMQADLVRALPHLREDPPLKKTTVPMPRKRRRSTPCRS